MKQPSRSRRSTAVAASVAAVLQIGRRSIRLSNPDKVLYPAVGFTKRQVVDYYVAVARYLLPHLEGRPVTLKRYPDGTKGQHFYEKDAPTFTPDWVKTFPVPRRGGGPDINYIVIDDVTTLAWCATLANLEIHPFLHVVPRLDVPTAVVFDLDPGQGRDVLSCAEVAFLLRQALDGVGLKAFPKVSGSKGLQLHVPLNTLVTYDETQRFALTTAQAVERAEPRLVITDMSKARRVGKVFIDWSQNSDYKTTVAVYSLRGKREAPFVSMPVRWEELEDAVTKRNADALYFDPDTALRRLQDVGDLFLPVLRLEQRLPESVVRPAGPLRARRMTPKGLAEYREKRDFSKTSEPSAGVPRASRQGGRRRFVVQKHAASHLHYDFRLEMHGVLKSWAVPKGVPLRRQERRLAMATEDHPIEYLDFEGTIPKGQYGGGTVMVWDVGTYDIIEGNYYEGQLDVSLRGKKLIGAWHLRRDEDRKWWLVKADDDAPRSRRRQGVSDTSALTGRTLERIAADNDRQWRSPRSSDGQGRSPSIPTRVSGRGPIDLSALPPAALEFVEPMRPLLVAMLPEGEPWSYEPKLDGYRALALKAGTGVRLLSRNNNTLNARFPTIAEALRRLPDGTIIDGEIVALNADGRPAFNLLRTLPDDDPNVYYYAFDALAYRGRRLLGAALEQRRKALGEAISGVGDPVRVSATLDAPARDVIAAAKRFGLEGIVAKRRDSLYEPGRRSGAWVKYRVSPGQALVIGGYLPGAHTFDALLVGYYERSQLRFVGKIRNGLTPETKAHVAKHFAGLEIQQCPFANLPEPKTARRGLALTAEAMKRCRWLKPQLVAHVEFTEWTRNDHLRHARFVGLRDDKQPGDVVRERAVRPGHALLVRPHG
jgi:bifunctional non-homologous end joining protein LigD